MNFVVGLSENLLTECRRLTAENLKVKQKLQASRSELSRYKDEVAILKNTSSKNADTQEELKSKNWDLETALETLNEP